MIALLAVVVLTAHDTPIRVPSHPDSVPDVFAHRAQAHAEPMVRAGSVHKMPRAADLHQKSLEHTVFRKGLPQGIRGGSWYTTNRAPRSGPGHGKPKKNNEESI